MRSVVTLAALITLPASLTFAQATQTTTPVTPQLDFSGVVFGNFQWRTDSAAKASTGGKPFDKFDIGRAYLTFRMPAGKRGSIRVTTDIFQQSPSSYYSGWTVRLKYGYYQHELSRNLFGVQDLTAVARVGMLQTVIIDYIETFWPRFIAVSDLEQYNFFPSSDLGASSVITLPKKRGTIYLTAVNGPGYTSAEIDRFKNVAGSLQFTPFANYSGFFRSLAFAPYYSKGWVASNYVNPPTSVSSGMERDRRGVFVGIKDRRLTGGFDFGQRVEDVETAPPAARVVAGQTSNLVSGFGFVRPLEIANPRRQSPVGLFLRLDRFDLNNSQPTSAANPLQRLVIAGLFVDVNARTTFTVDYQEMKQQAPTTFPTKTLFMHWVAYF